MGIFPVIALILPVQSNSEVNKYSTGAPFMEKSQSIQCQYEKDKNIRFFKHRKGFTTYTLEPGSHIIFMLNIEEWIENTSIRLAKELVFELRDTPSLSESLVASSWINQALYKFGGSDLQFESQKFSGKINITDMQNKGNCHGSIQLIFTDPSIDRTGLGRADLDISF